MGIINITPEALSLSGAKYRKDLLMMPVHAMQETLQYMTLRRGIRYSETVGELTGDIDMGPYSETRVDNEKMDIKGRTLYTFFGSVVKKFSPNSVVKSIYDSAITKGEELKNVDIARAVMSLLTAKIGHNLQTHIWDAVRNDSGSTSEDLFNGFDTITATEISGGGIATNKHNLFEFEEAITANNAVDIIKAFCEAASEFLVDSGQRVNLYCSHAIYRNYLKDYQATVGAIPYNTEYRKAVVEGFENVHFVPLYNKANSQFIHLSPASNMLVGVNQEGEEENIIVKDYAPFVLTYIATMFFGVQFESINPERLLLVSWLLLLQIVAAKTLVAAVAVTLHLARLQLLPFHQHLGLRVTRSPLNSLAIPMVQPSTIPLMVMLLRLNLLPTTAPTRLPCRIRQLLRQSL